MAITLNTALEELALCHESASRVKKRHDKEAIDRAEEARSDEFIETSLLLTGAVAAGAADAATGGDPLVGPLTPAETLSIATGVAGMVAAPLVGSTIAKGARAMAKGEMAYALGRRSFAMFSGDEEEDEEATPAVSGGVDPAEALEEGDDDDEEEILGDLEKALEKADELVE